MDKILSGKGIHVVNEDGSLTDLSGSVSAVEVSPDLDAHPAVGRLTLDSWQRAFIVELCGFTNRQMRILDQLLNGPTTRQRRIGQVVTRKYRARKGRK